MIAAVELYREGEVSIEKAAEIAGVNVVQFKEILTHKGVTRGIGAGVDELMRKTEELKIATR
jgi:predicted HTH domain antitoxin